MTLSATLAPWPTPAGPGLRKTAFEAVEPERLEDDAEVLQVARLGIGEVERNPAAIRPEFRTCADSRPRLYSRLQRRPEDR